MLKLYQLSKPVHQVHRNGGCVMIDTRKHLITSQFGEGVSIVHVCVSKYFKFVYLSIGYELGFTIFILLVY